MRESLKAGVGKLVSTAAVWPDFLALSALHQGVDWWREWIAGKERDKLDTVIETVAGRLNTTAETEYRGLDIAVAIETATAQFAKHRLSPENIAAHDFDVEAAVAEFQRRSEGYPPGTPEPVAQFCRNAVAPAVYRELLSDRDFLGDLERAFRQEVLRYLHRIESVPRDTLDLFLKQPGLRRLIAPAVLQTAPPLRLNEVATAALLQADHEIVPFHGREAERNDLLAWCLDDDPNTSPLRLYTGPGGIGKTRLMIQVCRELRERHGWMAGVLPQTLQGHWPGPVLDTLIEGDQPRLIVIDYVDTNLDAAAAVLDRLHRRPDGLRMRVVLLARTAAEAAAGTEHRPQADEPVWYKELRRRSRAAQDLLSKLVPREVQPAAPQSRRAAFDSARFGFAKAQAAAAMSGEQDEANREDSAQNRVRRAAEESVAKAAPPPDLALPHFDRMLFIHAAALASLEGKTLYGSTDLLDYVLERDERNWRRGLEAFGLTDLSVDVVGQAAALVTLTGGADDPNSARTLLRRAPLAEGQLKATLARLAGLLRQLYPSARALAPLRPDLLGEHLVWREVSKDSALLDAALERSDSLPAVFTVLTRLLERHPEAEAWIMRAAAAAEPLLDGQDDRIKPAALAFALEPLLPLYTLVLREFRVRVSEICLAAIVNDDDDSSALRASYLNNQAVYLGDLGRREDALQAVQEAVNITRNLASKRPNAFQLNLAKALNTLANCLSDLGRREDALQAASEAVDITRGLARKRPDAVRPHLAGSLSTLANGLSNLGRCEDALRAAQEAADITRDLACKRPDAVRPGLAMALNNLANHLSNLGRREDALRAAQEAVEITRDLARDRPDAFRPNLAMALNNLAADLSDLGRCEDALQAAQEAVNITRNLASKRPDAFQPNLAMALNTLANRLSDLGQCEEALQVASEAVEITRDLASKRPDAVRPHLAMALNNLANHFSNLGHHEDAFQVARDSVDIYRDLARDRPDAFRPGLAKALNNLTANLSDLGRREDALEAAQETADITRDLAREHPDAVRPDLAMALSNLANCLGDHGRPEVAVQAAQEAVDISRDLARKHPKVFQPDLAVSLAVLASALEGLERDEAAIKANHEAIETLRPVFLERPLAVQEWVWPMYQEYLRRCERHDAEPDWVLLAPIEETFRALRGES